jgi:F-type H+-transporting ATPase subunit delta
MTVASGSLPRRYARALISLAQEEGKVDLFGQELEGLSSVFQKTPELLHALSSDAFPYSERMAAVEEVGKNLSPSLKNFLLLLLQKERIQLLSEIFTEFQNFQDEIEGVVRVTVSTPQPPEKPLLESIEKVLGQKLKKKVIASGKSSPKMIGGLIMELDHTIYDGSVSRELEKIKESLLKA